MNMEPTMVSRIYLTVAVCLLVGAATAIAAPPNQIIMDMAYPCGIQHQPAFCDNFEEPAAPSGGRGGALDPKNWNFARFTDFLTPDQKGMIIGPTEAQKCKKLITGVLPDSDSFFCGTEPSNGPEPQHWMEAYDDHGSTMFNDAMIRQPFDFTNRTGTINFGVDAKSYGSHTWWVSLWITD